MKAKIKDCLNPALIGMEVKVLRPMSDKERYDIIKPEYQRDTSYYWTQSPMGRTWHWEGNLEFLK